MWTTFDLKIRPHMSHNSFRNIFDTVLCSVYTLVR